jgi:hypothetical protein
MRSLIVLALLALLPSSAPAAPRVFLVTELALRDPHAYASIPLLGCNDVTDRVPLGLAPSLNETIADALSTDGDGDGFLDLSPIIASLHEDDPVTGWSPAGQLQWDPSDPGGELAFHFAQCVPPQTSPTCGQDPAMPVEYSLFSNAVQGKCLGSRAGATSGYSPSIVTPSAPCFASDPFRMTMEVAGLALRLESARIGARYVGDPPTALVDGLIVGFLPEAVADTTLISSSVPFVGGQPVSVLLPGGTGCCAAHDDRDVGPDGQTPGWWLHFNFAAALVSFVPTDAPVHVAAVAPRLALGAAVPNPFTDGTRLSFALPAPGRVRLRVLDVSGRVVATLVDGPLPAGRHTASWSGAGPGGSPAVGGIYFVRLESGGAAVTRRVVRLR